MLLAQSWESLGHGDGAGLKDLLELYARKDGSQMDGIAWPRAQASGHPRTSGHWVCFS